MEYVLSAVDKKNSNTKHFIGVDTLFHKFQKP